MNAFLRGYVACALWLADEDDGEAYEEDLAPEALESMRADCAAFERDNEADLDAYEAETGRDRDHAGHDFWLTRNGHGTGFWDRGAGDVGKRLTAASAAYGDSDLYRGDDGSLYVSP
jgi:hypothetical protein